MNIDSLFSTFLKKEDAPTPIRAVIAGVEKRKVGQTDVKPVLLFQGDLKPMVLNKRNAKFLSGQFSQETNAWTGRLIEIYVDPEVMYGGERVGGLALRLPAASPPAQPGNGFIFWEWSKAVAEVIAAGGTEEGLKSHLRSGGFSGYLKARDSATVQAYVRQLRSEAQGLGDAFEGEPGEVAF